MKKITGLFKKVDRKQKISVVILTVFLLIGFFLRSYNFSEWLRFNADQSRDAALMKISSENSKLPLLGPKAGGTEFRLGPIFYYFQIVSAKVFGTEPSSAAYPDLFFSLLAIIMFFILSREIFNPKIALILAWLYTISYFTIKYSRFAWNPNSSPFFVMLYIYSFYKMLGADRNKKTIWAVISGAALGIGIQLHTSLLIILPVLTVLISFIGLKKKNIAKTTAATLLGIALLLNVPQIISEIKTKGENTYNFVTGIVEKNDRNSNIGKNFLLNLTCHAKANNHILTSLDDEEECDYNEILKTFKKFDNKKFPFQSKVSLLAYTAISLIFTLGSYVLLFRKIKTEENLKKKTILKLLSFYIATSFVFFIFWANELSIRFFLGLAFVPFLLFGFWLEFLAKKLKAERIVLIAAVAAVSFLNFQKINAVYKDYQFGGREINGNFEFMTLGEGRHIMSFIRQNSSENTVYIDAQGGYLFKFIKSLQFLAHNDPAIIQLEKEIKLESGSRLFYIKNADKGCSLPDKTLKKYTIENCSVYRQFAAFSLRVK